MIDTVRLVIDDPSFYFAVVAWRKDDLDGTVPARLNGQALRTMIEDGKVIDFSDYKEKRVRELLDDLNEHGLHIVIKDFFQLYKQGSWCRDITCVIDDFSHRIHVEVSLPKFFQGQNVDLLYDYQVRLLDFVCYLYQFFRVTIPPVERIRQFEVSRVDVCYFYKHQSQIHAFDMIKAFKMWTKHKRKKVHFYDTSMMFVGRSYSLKFYLKYDEFQRHDRKDIAKNITYLLDSQDKDNQKQLSDYTNMLAYCESMSSGMVRCEFTIRKQKLNYDGIKTLGDLVDLDIVGYYEKLLEKMGVLKMGHTQKEDYFERLKSNKKLLQYCALLETFGEDKVKELYNRSNIWRYNKMLAELNIHMNDFSILKTVDLSVRNDDRLRVVNQSDNLLNAVNFINQRLF